MRVSHGCAPLHPHDGLIFRDGSERGGGPQAHTQQTVSDLLVEDDSGKKWNIDIIA